MQENEMLKYVQERKENQLKENNHFKNYEIMNKVSQNKRSRLTDVE